MKTAKIPAALRGLTTDLARPKTWDGEQSKDREGRLLATVPVLIGRDVADVTVPQANIDKSIPVHTTVELTGVTIGHGKFGLWVSAESIVAVES